MRETRYDLDQFHRHMNYNSNTLIMSPRNSGKTNALVRKFVDTYDSILLVSNEPQRRAVHNLLDVLGCHDRQRNVYITSEGILRGCRVSHVFVDEIESYRGDLVQFGRSAEFSESRIIAVTTPSGRRTISEYEEVFRNIYNMSSGIFQSRSFGWIPETVSVEHFEEELFRI